MKKILMASLLVVVSLATNAQEFTGCGEYLFKGVLRADKKLPLKFKYIVHENSQSQMSFNLKEKTDSIALIGIIDQPTSLKAKILKKMDGTYGELTEPREISHRISKPLSARDTEIIKITDLKCN